ncbi:metalloendopeptidase OMA1, mitochondrial-like [Uloborus diversus]|uniref:metalloendopeptidase OMA1, mitochondrial-like n=1 Tax=Uloborus diversus TaxID=327109 RepID=UPI002409ADAC|nr:metalloendopeptidase OMA1, mitochondrial-like [Uloborus diversus]
MLKLNHFSSFLSPNFTHNNMQSRFLTYKCASSACATVARISFTRCFPSTKNLTKVNPNVHREIIFEGFAFRNKSVHLRPKNSSIIPVRKFHKSELRHVHPVVWFVAKPVLKLFAVLSGRGFRKWWKDLPVDKKKYFLGIVKKNRNKIGIGAFAFATLCFIYYVSHLEETPITKRRRFIAFTPEQLEKINAFELQQILEGVKQQILPSSHPASVRVSRVVHRILTANSDIEEVRRKTWNVAVIESSLENAFVLPIGYVFVFTGMLKLCSNDDQLGTILAHEIAHCIQNHGAENVSFVHLLDLLSIIIIAAIWAVLPSDSISVLTHWLYQKSIQIFLQLPYSRKIETEADNVGLQLAAKACFDVRESSAFWSKMAILKNTFGSNSEIEFLSTHPSHEKRSEYLDGLMEEALKIRTESGCPRLRATDPRMDVEGVAKALEVARKAYLNDNPKPVFVYATT